MNRKHTLNRDLANLNECEFYRTSIFFVESQSSLVTESIGIVLLAILILTSTVACSGNTLYGRLSFGSKETMVTERCPFARYSFSNYEFHLIKNQRRE